MDLIVANTRKLKMKVLKFYKDQYTNNPLTRDGMSGLLKEILFEKSVMSKNIDIIPLLVIEDGKIYCTCVLAHAKRMPETLQISFYNLRIIVQLCLYSFYLTHHK